MTPEQIREMVWCMEKALEYRFGSGDDSWVAKAERLLETAKVQ